MSMGFLWPIGVMSRFRFHDRHPVEVDRRHSNSLQPSVDLSVSNIKHQGLGESIPLARKPID